MSRIDAQFFAMAISKPVYQRAKRLPTMPELRCSTDGRMHPPGDFYLGRYGCMEPRCKEHERERLKQRRLAIKEAA